MHTTSDPDLFQLFGRTAEQHPARAAVRFQDSTMSYAELQSRVRTTTARLRRRGVRPGDIVAVAADRGTDAIIALLATFGCAAAWMPVDPSWPPTRRADLISAARPRLLLTDTPEPLSNPGVECPEVPLTRITAAEPNDAEPNDDRVPPLHPELPAYILHTSGSTGTPKGVVVPHRGLLNRVLWAISASGLGPQDRLLQKTALSFDASLWEMLAPLLVGGCVVLLPPGKQADATAVVRAMRDNNITIVQGVPTWLRAIAGAPGLERCTDLRLVFSAGEALSVSLVRRLAARLPSLQVVNTYGPAECSIDASHHLVTDPAAPTAESVPTDGTTVPIGVALPGVRLRTEALTADAAPAATPAHDAPDSAAELLIGGIGLAHGYLHRPALTAERFVPDPDGPPGSRVYRTGDLVRHGLSGYEFVGRIDDQVKIRGVRVEPAEVEARLAELPGVRAAAVTSGLGPDGALRLLAWATVEPWAQDRRTLRRLLSEQLPSSHLPSMITFLDRIPTTSSGKIDRTALPDPNPGRTPVPAAATRASDAAISGVELTVTNVLAEVLQQSELGPEQHFLDAGGHSLLAHRVAVQLSSGFGVPIDLRDVLEGGTARALARVIASRLSEARTVPPEAAGSRNAESPPAKSRAVEAGRRPRVPAAGTTPPDAGTSGESEKPVRKAPASLGQQRLWMLDQLGRSAEYRILRAFRLTGTVDTATLWAAVRALARRHPVLRTGYRVDRTGDLEQIVVPASCIPAGPPQGWGEPDGDPDNVMDALIRDPLPLSSVPVRVRLVRTGSDEYLLAIAVHHICCDERSEQILLQELSQLYHGGGESPGLPASYAEFACRDRERTESAALERDLAFWETTLAGYERTTLPGSRPVDEPRPPADRISIGLPAATATSVSSLATRHGCTVFTAMLAVFALALADATGCSDVGIGTMVTGRDRPETLDTVGFFVNPVVLRIDTGGSRRFGDLLASVREVVLDAAAHSGAPFEAVASRLAPGPRTGRGPSDSPLFQVTFGMEERTPLELPGIEVSEIEVPVPAPFDLTVMLRTGTSRSDTSVVDFEFPPDRVDRDVVRGLADRFATLIDRYAREPEMTALPLSPASSDSIEAAGGRPAPVHDESATALDQSAPSSDQPTAGDDRPASGVAARIQYWATATPHGRAVDGMDTRIDYRQLDLITDGLARNLRARGLRRGDVVAVLVDRSARAVVLVLALLRSGLVYAPIGREQPAARRDEMIRRLGAALAVAEDAADLPAGDTECVLLDELLRLQAGSLVVTAHATGTVQPADRASADSEPAGGTALGGDAADHDPADGDPAYLLHTSGTSGRPKAVLIQHGALSAHCVVMRRVYRIDPGDRMLLASALIFDPSIEQIVGTISAGATVVVTDPHRYAPAVIPDRVRDNGITHLALAAPVFREMLGGPGGTDCPTDPDPRVRSGLAGLSTMAVGGAVLTGADVRAWSELGTGGRLLNVYGPTEATVMSLYHPVTALDGTAVDAAVPIGRPVDGTSVQILDQAGDPVDRGGVGELCLGGDRLAVGYPDRPASTAELFVPDPSGAGRRMYRTGDLVRERPDGVIEFCGRTDDQVKIRGHRVEPAEVDAALQSHPAVSSSAVLVARQGSEPELHGFFVGRVQPSEIRRHLRTTLPEHMIPTTLITLDRMPLTETGKIDRPALVAAAGAAADPTLAETVGRPPDGEIEQAIAACWSTVLSAETRSATTSFFDAGGNSLLAMRLAGRLEQTFGLEIPLSELFTATTIETQAAALAELAALQASAAGQVVVR